MLDIDNPNFWKSIRPNATITLKDKQAIEDSMARGEGLKGIDYLVKNVYRLKEMNNLGQWILFFLEDPEDLIWIMVKIVETQVEIRVYFEHPQFKSGNRKDMIEQGNFWLFMEPDDPEQFQYNDLEFTDLIEIDADDGQLLSFRQKEFGQMYCTCETEPDSTAAKDSVATITEYQSNQPCENPEMLLFELGGRKSSDGGLIRLMLGTSLRPTEIDILEA